MLLCFKIIDAMLIRVHVKPNAINNLITIMENELHVRIREMPVDGKANKYLQIIYRDSCVIIPKGFYTCIKSLQ